jgi:hypothetical protein
MLQQEKVLPLFSVPFGRGVVVCVISSIDTF